MRKLEPNEILEVAKKVGRRSLWDSARAVIAELYDVEQVVGFDVNAHSEYNDQDYDQEGELKVFGADGDQLPYDFSKPFFRRYALTESDKKTYLETQDLYAFSTTLREALEAKHAEALGLDFDVTGSEGELEDFAYRFYYLIPPKYPEVFVEA